MTTEVLSQALQAGVQATFPQGRVFYIKTASSPLTIVAESLGTGGKIRKFANLGAGMKFTAKEGDGWTYLRVTSAVSQNVELIVGDDDVEVANAVSVSGVAVVQSQPSSTITASPADVSLLNANASTIPANATRRRITVGALSTNTGSLRVQTVAAGANKGLELQPGIYQTFETTAALDVRNDSGAAQSFWSFEES